jgi:hypothetical protein
MAKPRTIWKVELRPPADDQDDGALRVRRALKNLLRGYGLTCTAVVKVEAEEPATDQEVTT